MKPSPKNPLQAVTNSVPGLAPVLDSFAVITACLDYLRVREEEITKRAHIAARRDVLISAISAERELIAGYFASRFHERSETLNHLFAVLKQGADTRDHVLIDRSLAGILSVLQENPLADLEAFRTVWRDRSVTLEI